MNKKWRTERQWDANHSETAFEEIMVENGFTVKGIKEYISRTDFLFEKDGVEIEWHFYAPAYDSSKVDFEKVDMNVKMATDMWEMHKKLIEKERSKA